jgi:UDP-N-acetylmuramoylalanine--D-glutamate ligase
MATLAQARGGQGRRALVVGLGRTGVSAARFLAARGWSVAVTDSRAEPPGLEPLRAAVPDAAVFVGGFSETALSFADEVVLSPGVPLADPFVLAAAARGLPIVGDVELFARAADAPVIAITGSNGKSTVTTLVGQMAERAGSTARVGGNLGIPALDLLDGAPPDLFVLELSSFQLECTRSLRAVAACVLNVSADHLDRYASLGDYAAAKARVYDGCHVAVVNRADPLVAAMAGGGSRVSFGPDAPRRAEDWGVVGAGARAQLAVGGVTVLPVAELRLRGAHNAQNALAALALGEAAGLPRDAMCEALREFTGLPHRTELVAEKGGVAWINDSKGTNVGATLAAVEGLAGPLVLILGGDGKGQDFAPLAAAFAGKVRAAVLIGRDADAIGRALGARIAQRSASNMEQAVEVAASLAQPGDTVLLSPACSSLDMFESFEHRGRAFVHAVRRIAA